MGSVPPRAGAQPDPLVAWGRVGSPVGAMCAALPGTGVLAVALGLCCREVQLLQGSSPVHGLQLLLWAIFDNCAGLTFVGSVLDRSACSLSLLCSLPPSLSLLICDI